MTLLSPELDLLMQAAQRGQHFAAADTGLIGHVRR